MPAHLLPASSRRRFLRQCGAVALLSPLVPAAGAAPTDPDLVAVLNDTHIGAQQKADSRVRRNLQATVADLLNQERRPAAVVINGDLALHDGRRGDYEAFVQLLAPLREAGLSVHLTLGNHDARAVFHEVLGLQPGTAVASRHVSLVPLARANLILLDSLQQTMTTPGRLGGEQLDWLARTLDAQPDQPALVFAHHNPRLGGDPKHFPGGLEDSEPLWQVLADRPQVKAYIHGHIHHRDRARHAGIHILNTPATSYVADPETSTTGWTLLKLGERGCTCTTRTHLADHPWNRLAEEIAWR